MLPRTVGIPMRIAVEKANDERLALLELSRSDMAYRGTLPPEYIGVVTTSTELIVKYR